MQAVIEAVATQDVVAAANIAALARAEARLVDYTVRHDAEEASFDRYHKGAGRDCPDCGPIKVGGWQAEQQHAMAQLAPLQLMAEAEGWGSSTPEFDRIADAIQGAVSYD
ncbi:MAG: hypothetical protein ACYCTZ_04620 [Candidatus Dormibacteria bacterium]